MTALLWARFVLLGALGALALLYLRAGGAHRD
jgi:hypothetical protein